MYQDCACGRTRIDRITIALKRQRYHQQIDIVLEGTLGEAGMLKRGVLNALVTLLDEDTRNVEVPGVGVDDDELRRWHELAKDERRSRKESAPDNRHTTKRGEAGECRAEGAAMDVR